MFEYLLKYDDVLVVTHVSYIILQCDWVSAPLGGVSKSGMRDKSVSRSRLYLSYTETDSRPKSGEYNINSYMPFPSQSHNCL